MTAPEVSILIPAYEARDTLPRLVESLERLEPDPTFEVLIIDDGSVDGTGALGHDLARRTSINMACYTKAHEGKGQAINAGISHCTGRLVFLVDADDVLPPHALRRLTRAWYAIPDRARDRFAAVEGHAGGLSTGAVIGSDFPRPVFDSDHIRTRYALGIKGDKKRLVRTSVLLDHPFPRFGSEDYIPMSWAWNAIGMRYRTRYIDEVIYLKEYLPTGLTAQRPSLAVRNAVGSRAYHERTLDQLLARPDVLSRYRYRTAANVVRFRLHCSLPPLEAAWNARKRALVAAAAPIGAALYARDQRDVGRARPDPTYTARATI